MNAYACLDYMKALDSETQDTVLNNKELKRILQDFSSL